MLKTNLKNIVETQMFKAWFKDIFNTSLESEALKETLYRQAKTQVCDWLLNVHSKRDGNEEGKNAS